MQLKNSKSVLKLTAFYLMKQNVPSTTNLVTPPSKMEAALVLVPVVLADLAVLAVWKIFLTCFLADRVAVALAPRVGARMVRSVVQIYVWIWK